MKFSRLLMLGSMFFLIILATSCIETDDPSPGPTPNPVGKVVFDNWTSEVIDCYINSNFQGTVSAWGEFTVNNVPTGNITLYAESTLYYWGPTNTYLSSGETKTWQLK